MENYPWIIHVTPLYLELWIVEFISDFFLAFLLIPWHFSKGQCTDHYHFENRFENISQRKMKQILQEFFFMIVLGKFEIRLKRFIVAWQR